MKTAPKCGLHQCFQSGLRQASVCCQRVSAEPQVLATESFGAGSALRT